MQNFVSKVEIDDKFARTIIWEDPDIFNENYADDIIDLIDVVNTSWDNAKNNFIRAERFIARGAKDTIDCLYDNLETYLEDLNKDSEEDDQEEFKYLMITFHMAFGGIRFCIEKEGKRYRVYSR